MSTSFLDHFQSLQQEAHVWYCNPQGIFDPDRLAQFSSLLSEAESRRYRGIRFNREQRSYLVSHALVRKALSMYVDIPPQDWEFAIGEHGKPEIENVSDTGLRFNLAHTDDLCACVITRDIRCGVDAEYTQRKNKLLPIARRMFSDVELKFFENKTEDEIRQRFFYYWTLREAYVKAQGTGLGGSSKTFHFELDEKDGVADCLSARISFVDKKQNDSAEDWQFEIFKPDVNHVLSVALQSLGAHKAVQWRFMEP